MSDGAIAAKARAMFGSRLSEEDYMKLIQKKSVPELAYALKHDTYFSETLAGINEKGVHRGALENLLKMDVFTRLKKLLLYTDDDQAGFIYAAVMNVEEQMILMCIRSFTNDDEQDRRDMIQRMPIYIEKYLSFPIQELSEVDNFHDLLEVLKGTKYEPIIKRYQSNDFKEINYIGLEHELHNAYYDVVLDLITHAVKGSAADEMKRDTLTRVELDNISIIYRLKKYFNASSEDIKALMTPRYAMFTSREIDKLIYECNADQVIEQLQKKYHTYISNVRFTDIEHYTQMIRFRMNHHFIEYYTEPSLVLLSYLMLSEMEIDNVINIIEGVRYHINPERIKTLLVY
jgi:V/A-type H+-transporting ATPase subunit C